jgi:hypothetical protein
MLVEQGSSAGCQSIRHAEVAVKLNVPRGLELFTTFLPNMPSLVDVPHVAVGSSTPLSLPKVREKCSGKLRLGNCWLTRAHQEHAKLLFPKVVLALNVRNQSELRDTSIGTE